MLRVRSLGALTKRYGGFQSKGAPLVIILGTTILGATILGTPIYRNHPLEHVDSGGIYLRGYAMPTLGTSWDLPQVPPCDGRGMANLDLPSGNLIVCYGNHGP